MNWKFALALSALGATFAAHLGCGGNECTLADDQVANCASNVTSSVSAAAGGDTLTYTCAGVRLCQSLCINKSTCAEITGNLPKYAMCITACDGQGDAGP